MNVTLKRLFVASLIAVPMMVSAQDIEINAKNFPDENFRAYLLELWEGADGVFKQWKLEAIHRIEVNNRNIKTLKGIEYFTALTYLE